MMKKKKRAAAEQAFIEQASIEQEASLRKSSFLRATQSDRFTILVGLSQTSFQVPEDLLKMWVPSFKNACQYGFEEFQKRCYLLPEVKASTFENFLIWMYACEPSVELKDMASVLDLAIFAEFHIICQLKNQTSDILRSELGSGRWQLTPDDVSMVYDEVPSGAILRQLCSISVALAVSDPPSLSFGHSSNFGSSANAVSAHRQYDNYIEWESAFENHPDLGWDYFRHIQTGHDKTTINCGGPCRFHDHSDILGVRREYIDKCPYPRGALPTEQHTRSLPNEYPLEISVEGHNVEEEGQLVLEEPQPVVEEAVDV